MLSQTQQFELRFARDADDLRAAQRLRYEVFVAELGGDGPLVDHDQRLERDALDDHFRHLILFDRARAADDQAVGVYRLLSQQAAEAAGGFYTESEYDISVLKSSGRKLLELGRSCMLPDYRGGAGMYHLWNGLAEFVQSEGVEILFGTASFHGTDVQKLAPPLAFLHHRHLAPPDLRVKAHAAHFQTMDLMPEDQIDRRAAVLAIPALIKAYLRLGGVVGEGAYIDHAFNTTDICLVMDTARLNARQKAIYTREGQA